MKKDEVKTLTPGVTFENPRVYTPDGRIISTDSVIYDAIGNSELLASQEILQYFDSSVAEFYKAGIGYNACTILRLTLDRYLSTLNNLYEVFCIKCKRMCPPFKMNEDTRFITNEAKMMMDAVITYLSYDKEKRLQCDLVTMSMTFCNAISAKIYNNARMQLSSYVVSLTNEDSIDNEDISDAYNELDKYMTIMMGDIIYESSVFIDALYKIDPMIINSSNINIPKLEG
jgi:hypothetical protein